MHNTSHEFGFVVVTNQRSLKVISEISPNFVVLCKNDVICAFHLPITMELILVAFISAGMAENSQNGDIDL